MGRNDKRQLNRYCCVLAILLIAQMTDLVPIPDQPSPLLYLFGVFIDYSVIIAITLLWHERFPIYAKLILTLQTMAIITHGFGGISEYIYQIHLDERVAKAHDFYTPILIGILVAKMLVIGTQGGIIFNRIWTRPLNDIPLPHHSRQGIWHRDKDY
jgi:hypothetical protein